MDQIALIRDASPAEAKRLRRQATQLERGVYLQPGGDPQRLENRARAALEISPPGSVVTGVTTLSLAGAPLPNDSATEAARRIHLLVPATAKKGPRRAGIASHTRGPHCPSLIHKATGISAAPLSHSWVDAVRWLSRQTHWPAWGSEPAAARGRFQRPAKRTFLEAVQLGDGLLRRHRPLSELERLRLCADTAVGPGSKLVHAAFKQVRDRTDSFMETWLRLVVWDAGFPDPEVNLEVWAEGRQHFIDLSWPDQMIALEYHGQQHFDQPDQALGDVGRRGRLQRADWSIHEAVYADLLDPAGLIGRLAHAFGW